MFAEEQEIPLIGRLETTATLLRPGPMAPSRDRRLEEWIASNLDQEADPARENHWNRLIKNLPAFRPRARTNGKGGAALGPATDSQGGWSHFRVAYRRGYTMVRVADQSLVQRSLLRELEADLMDLIAVGNHRMVLNFSGVEKLGSWIIGVVGNAHRRCAEADGGRLKICGLDPQLAEIFAIVGMARELELHPDEAAAISSPWPACSAPRQLPVDLLEALRSVAPVPPICGGAPSQADEPMPPPDADGKAPARPNNIRGFSVRLELTADSGDGRSLAVTHPRWLIGRDRSCKIRLNSAQVSKQHAAIEIRDDRIFVRDLESTNGTLVNGKVLRDAEIELRHGDEFRIGPVRFRVAIDRSHSSEPLPEDPATVVIGAHPEARQATAHPHSLPAGNEPLPTEEMPVADDADGTLRIRTEDFDGVTVVTPLFPDLDGEEAIEALRTRLESLREEPGARRVVVNLEFVNHLSRKAIAFLLAHHVRLEWEGGGLRICQAHARIIALLDQVRLTMLVDCFPTVDEAVLCAWSGVEERATARP
ncbi:FHA domain protein [Aquisphaera giovannonii]|uniref:FHA domain protein n=1 Tax=Aquisphaera giovannonii TaxID=406548 RepID=A0A5B9VZY6_9BACT|nr:FHA domain-containing protein [Aquisphaera giovannonii]QEH33561.1 FHA domain protein [Aquisphaera giovannonii]